MNAPHFLANLFEKHQPELRRLISLKFKKSHADAEDIIQDAFHNILRNDNLSEIENPKAYLYQTASNLALNRIRKQKQHTLYVTGMNIDDDSEIDEISPERSIFAHRDLHRIEQALVQLPLKYRRTFLLSRIQEKTYREISEMLSISESTVEKHIIKTLKHLRDHLKEDVAP